MHPEDRIQTYKNNGEEIRDGGITFDELMAKEEFPRCGGSMVIIFRKNNDKTEILLQKRAKTMSTDPGKWDAHGGFMNYGETHLETVLREAKEELGLNLNPEKLTYCFQILQSKFEFCSYYLYDFTGEDQEIRFLDKEVEEVKWVDKDLFLKRDQSLDLKSSFLRNDILFNLLAFYLEQYGNLDK